MSLVTRSNVRPFLRTIAAFTAAAAVAAISACSSDSLTQPNVVSRDSKGPSVNSLTLATALTRDVPVPAGMVRSFTFGQKGGTIDLSKETGLKIDVPEGAIPGTTLTITVTALPGTVVAYDFQPHGTVFLKPLAFRQDLSRTSWDKLGFKGTVTGGYFKDPSQVNLQTGASVLDELFPVLFNGKEISFDIHHFSGYLVSTGRSEEESLF